MKTNNNSTTKTSKHVARQNKTRANQREYLNQTFAAEGIAFYDNDNGIFGFQDLVVWNPRKQKLEHLTKNDQDKFLVTAESIELAITEFWARWKIFVQRAYGVAFIRIERKN